MIEALSKFLTRKKDSKHLGLLNLLSLFCSVLGRSGSGKYTEFWPLKPQLIKFFCFFVIHEQISRQINPKTFCKKSLQIILQIQNIFRSLPHPSPKITPQYCNFVPNFKEKKNSNNIVGTISVKFCNKIKTSQDIHYKRVPKSSPRLSIFLCFCCF